LLRCILKKSTTMADPIAPSNIFVSDDNQLSSDVSLER
jgi:hypothetical protein